jgi:hypothetical protein
VDDEKPVTVMQLGAIGDAVGMTLERPVTESTCRFSGWNLIQVAGRTPAIGGLSGNSNALHLDDCS